MPNPAIKIVTSIAFFGSLTTGSYFLRNYYSKERINHRIENQGMTLLNDTDKDTEWVKRWKEYVADSKDVWRLKDYNKLKTTLDKVSQVFKNKCLNGSGVALEGNYNFATEIEKFCTKSFKVVDLLSKESGVTILKKEDDQNLWKGVWSKYLEDNKDFEKDPLSITNWATEKNNKETLPSDYISKCTTEQEKEIRRKKDLIYQNVKSWCSKQS